MASCAVCGGGLPDGAAYCPHCGSKVLTESATETAVLPAPPPHETGPVPVEKMRADPHLFGVTPPMTVFALAAAALAVAVLLLVLGYLVAGLLVLGAALLLLLAFVATAPRRSPGGAAAQMRDRARATGTALTERAAARREVGRLLREREQLRARRADLVRALGEAVYAGDEDGTQALRTELAELDRAAADKEGEMQAVAERARERIGQARREVAPTVMVEIPGDPGQHPPGTVPGPGTVPEPAPVPSPQPGPEPIPEPGPVPSPQPGPVPVPEPTPVPSPQPGPVIVPEPTPAPSSPAEASGEPGEPARS